MKISRRPFLRDRYQQSDRDLRAYFPVSQHHSLIPHNRATPSTLLPTEERSHLQPALRERDYRTD